MKKVISFCLVFSVCFSQIDPETGLEIKNYREAKIYYKNNGFVEKLNVKDFSISSEKVWFTVGKEKKSQSLSEISKIEVAVGGDQNAPKACAGACVGINLLGWLATPDKTEQNVWDTQLGYVATEVDNPDKPSVGQFLVGALLWGGLSYFIGKGIAKELTKWEVIYEK